VSVQVGVQVSARVRVSAGEGVAESTGRVTGCKKGELVGASVSVGVILVKIFPSVMESEKAPRIKPMEARAMIIPRKTCRKFFIIGSLLADLSKLASER